MINPDAELSRLRSFLMTRGWLHDEVGEIIDSASNDINEAILDIVSSAVAEITDYAIELGAEEFLEDVDVVEVGGSFMITTRSGTANYSVPERQMLPDLLKNADISQEGKKYKVIPVGAKRSQSKDIFSMMRDLQAAQREAREEVIRRNMAARSERAQAMASQFNSIISSKLKQLHDNRLRRLRAEAQAAGGKPNFATASEKQDPATTWVAPAKELDMTGELMNINKRISEDIHAAVLDIISMYESEFA